MLAMRRVLKFEFIELSSRAASKLAQCVNALFIFKTFFSFILSLYHLAILLQCFLL